ncbi:PAX3- and PAX7-binding protein 1-like [Centruroides sculpturatus]|uniref:PAX3- and PAX7-binding protein 1-like n=1 Tax=Centruroides sculpturatus TaxID=218467 RepID=UPI000C6CBC62|nr:PAX3- and PAX7-binding protein 1-like [Centruroides sculpturatus]
MSLFKKPNRKFRQRVTHSDSEDEEINKDKLDKNDINDQEKPKPKVNPNFGKEENENTDKSKRVGTKLSFHDEEDDGEVFKVKKSNYSRRLARRLEKERKKKLEKNEEIKKSEEFMTDEIDDQKEEMVQADKDDSMDILNGEDAEDMEIDSENEDNEKNKLFHPFKNVLKSGVIPDAATIYAVKKHRQMAREMGDFVALDDTKRVQETKSRLIRDDDNDRSDEDEGEEGRISFTVNVAAVERQKAREAFLSAQEREENEMENEEADELERWEREQIRKGVSMTQIQQQLQTNTDRIFGYNQQNDKTVKVTSNTESKPPSRLANLSIPRERKDLTVNDIKSRLSERLSALEEMYANHQREDDSCNTRLANSYDLINQLEKEGPLLASRFSLYQQMRGYVTDLVECLDLKVAKIEIIEKQMNELLKARAEKFVQRRQQDIRDQADEYSIISTKGFRGSNLEMLDGKSVIQDEVKLRRVAEREGRRMRRRKAREIKNLIVKHHDGMSSDDEEIDIDVLKHKEQQSNGWVTKWSRWQPTALGDTGSNPDRLKSLRNFSSDSPFGYSGADFEQMKWYEVLIFYSCNNENLEDIDSDDPDLNLIPSIVEKVVLPKLTVIAREIWDPVSTCQTLQLVNLTKRIIEDYPNINGKSKNTQEYLHAVITRIYRTLDEDVFIPLYPRELLENRTLGAVTFFQRQFWSCVKLLRNILSWHGILSEQSLQDLAFNCLLNRYLLLALQNSQMQKDTVDKCRTIVSTLPRAWFSQLKGSKTLPQLQMFARLLKQFAQSQDEIHFKDIIKEFAQMLITIGALEEATELAKQFSIINLRSQLQGKVS